MTAIPRTSQAENLLAALARQKFLVDQLGALTKKQEAIVRDAQPEPLLDLLGTRQELIDRILAAQREIVVLASSFDREDAQPMAQADREQAATMMEAIKTGLSAVMKRDDEDRETIRSIREQTHGELNAIGNVRQAVNAYLPRAAADHGGAARFADRKG